MKNFYAVLFGLGVLLFAVLSFEAVIRIIFPEVKPAYTNRDLIQINAYYDSNGLKPLTKGISHGEVIETDRYGLRKTFTEKDSTLDNWLYLGDSVTMGIGIATDKTFAYYADRHLKKIKIRNAAVIGHSSYDYVNAARHYAGQMAITKITVFYCLNDVYSRFKDQTIPGDQVRQVGAGLLDFIKLNFRLYHVFKANLFDRPAAYYKFVRPFYRLNNPIFQSTLRDIRTLRDFCHEQKIQLDMVILPYEYQLRQPEQENVFEPQMLLHYNLRYDEIPVYDCARFIMKRGYPSHLLYLYGDGIHFSEYGHHLIFDYLIDVVLENSDLLMPI